MRTTSAILLLAAVNSSCWLDPTCRDHCDGDAIVRCDWACEGADQKIDLPDSCDRGEARFNCDDGFTCVMTNAFNGGGSNPSCLPAPLEPCDTPRRTICTGPHSSAVCRDTEQGGVIGDTYDNVCGEPGHECQTMPGQIICVDSPKVSCDPSEHKTCVDAATLQLCYGGEEEGYSRKTRVCDVACSGQPGEAVCD